MSDDKSKTFQIPRLGPGQTNIVILGLTSALQRTIIAYAMALGPHRFDDFSKFKASLIDEIKNAPILGLRQEDEADAVLAAFKIVESAFLIAAKGNGWKSD